MQKLSNRQEVETSVKQKGEEMKQLIDRHVGKSLSELVSEGTNLQGD